MCLEYSKCYIKATFSLVMDAPETQKKTSKNTTNKHPKPMKNRAQKPPKQSFEKTTQKQHQQ